MFKQLPTMISELNKLGIALKALDGMNLATVGINTGNLDSFRSAIKSLSTEQAVFALASKGATEEQIRQILITKQSEAADVEAAMAKVGLTTATSALTQAEMVELATKTGVAKADAEALLSKIGITAAEEGQVAVKRQVTMAMLEQAVANGTLTSAESAQIVTMLGLNAAETANIGITNILTGAFAKLWAVITAHPIGAILTAVGAVAVGVIAYINKSNKDAQKAIVETHEKAQQALDDTKTALSDDKSELESVNSELDSTKQKIQDIASQGTITLTEQNELDKLSTANTQLETQKSLLENNIKLKQKSAALDAKNLLGTQVEMDYSDIQDGKDIVSHKESYTYAEHAEYEARSLKNAYNIYMSVLRDRDAEKQKITQELIDAAGGDIAELTSSLLEIVESFKYDDGTIIEGYEDLYNQYMGLIYNLQSLTNPEMFLDIAKQATQGTNIDYEKAISDGYAMAYNGNFDINKLNQDFVNALANNGIDESTIEYIFKLKQQEYQSVVDRINEKYKVSQELPDTAVVRKDTWNADGTVSWEYEEVKVDEEAKNQIKEVNKINQALNVYAKENPIEFQLVTSFDEDFTILDKYIAEEKANAKNALQDTKNQLADLSKNGNVDLTIRPVIDSSAMQAAGWDVEDGSIATTFTQGEFIWQGDEENGQYVYVHYTPILPDGTVLTPDQLSEYLYGTLEGSQNILDADNKGLVLKVDTDLQGISEDDIKALQEGGKQSAEMSNFLNQMGQWDDSLHDVQEGYYLTGDSVDYVDNAVNRLVEDAKKAKGEIPNEKPILSFTEAVSNVQELSKGFDQLDKIYADVFNKEEFDWSSILNNTSFTEAFGKTEDVTEEYKAAYNDFIKTISNSPDDINKCQEAFNNLATEYIKNSGALDNLSESTKQATINMLEEMGIQNAEEIVTDLLTQKQAELEAQKYYTANATNDLKDATISEYLEFINEANVSDEAKKQLAKLALQKISTNNVKINTADDIDQIIALANAAGASAIQLAKLADAKAIIEKYNTTGLNGTTADLRKYEEAQTLIKSIEEGTYKIESTLDASVFKAKYTGGSTTQKAADSAKKTADDLYKNLKEQIDAYMDYMDKSLDAGKIDYNTYCSSIKNYLDDLYNSGKLKAKDYFDYTEKMLNKQKDIYDKVISAVVNRFEEEVDKWQEKIDELESANDKLNDNLSNMDSALDAIDRVYDNEIDRIQAIIDGLKDANDERDRTLALEKAKYELEKAYNSKVKKLYVEGKGYIYTPDYDAIKDAQSSYDDAELDLKTSELQKQISELENFKSKWADVKNAYQYNIDAMNATALFGSEYQKLILNNNILDVENFKNQYVNIQQQINSNEELIKSYNEKVEYYNKLKEQWQSLTSEYEKQMNAQYAAQVLGADWEAKVISGRVDVLNAFKNDYITIQQSIVDAQQAAAKAQMESLQALVNAEIAAANAIKQARKAAYDNSDVPSSPNINSNHKYTQSNINNMIKGGAPSSVVDAINKQQGTNLKGGTGNAQTYRTINDYKKAQAAQKKLANNIRQYSKGGIVKVDPNNILSDLAKRHGEDGGALVRNGEEILTEKESKDHRRGMDLFEDFSNMLKNNKYLPQMVSAFNKPYNMDKTDNTSVIVTIGDINLQGVQNTDQLGEDIWKRLPSYITRKFNPKQR